ncbi:helix-turn-helix domain-containing protein [Longitalea luteola]|uniref:helix-turn-helix domain-containing protein n=1 Tax=Longitalea luteola TaxID=2812563 RepID=UPI001A958CDB|nr:helix-turn-helix domain-containing protein [Longitalea luteola]
MIALQTYIPSALTGLVKSFWQLKVTGLNDASYREDILPDGHHEIIFHVTGENAKRTTESARWIKEPDAFFAGQTLRSYSLELENNSLLYGIRFHPHTLHFLFGFPADLLTNNMLPLHDIPAAYILKNCISEHFEETCSKLEMVLLQLCKKADLSVNRFHYIDYAVQEIIKSKGDISISHLLNRTGISQRYFDTVFRESVGINPKSFCNIVKLNSFISYKNKYPHKKLTECCYESNFFDQSHFIKLFKSVTGKLPKEYFKNYNHINDYFTEM